MDGWTLVWGDARVDKCSVDQVHVWADGWKGGIACLHRLTGGRTDRRTDGWIGSNRLDHGWTREDGLMDGRTDWRVDDGG